MKETQLTSRLSENNFEGKPDLWFFDVDGTLSEKSLEILRKSKDGKFSLVTGRGFIRSKEIVERGFPLGSYVIIECGGRITDITGKDLVRHPFSQKNALDVFKVAKEELEANNLEYLGFFGLTGHKCNIFCADRSTQRVLQGKYPHVIDGFPSSLSEAKKVFLEKGCVKFTMKLKSGNPRESESFSCAKNDSEFSITEHGVNKATAIEWISSETKIPLSRIGVAGNDFNDIPMFELPLCAKISVGEKCARIKQLSTHHVNNKSQLPAILEKLI